jgi:hypothetical protein
LFLAPGKFVLSGLGAIDVGPFHVTVEGPAPFEWSNREQTQIVDRSRRCRCNGEGKQAVI